jgi:hypothetical protein
VTPGNLELVQVIASWAVTVPAYTAVLVFDERRLSAEHLARSWPPVSRDAAIFGSWLVGTIYGCVGVLVHFAVTRRSVRGALAGLLLAAFLLVLDVGAELGVAAAIDWLGL